MPNCPDCGSSFTRRIPRTVLMRLIPTSSHILCNHCGERSLVLFPQLTRATVERPIVRPAQQRRNVY